MLLGLTWKKKENMMPDKKDCWIAIIIIITRKLSEGQLYPPLLNDIQSGGTFVCRRDCMAKWIMGVPGSNLAGGKILCRPKQPFIALSQTFDQNFMEILLGVKEIWSRHKIKSSNSRPSIVTIILSQHGWVMGPAQNLTEENIWPKLNENPSKGKGDMERTQN